MAKKVSAERYIWNVKIVFETDGKSRNMRQKKEMMSSIQVFLVIFCPYIVNLIFNLGIQM